MMGDMADMVNDDTPEPTPVAMTPDATIQVPRQLPLTPEQAKELKNIEARWKTMNRHERRAAEVKIRKWLKAKR